MNHKILALLVAATFAAPTLAAATDFTGFGAGVELQFKSTEFRLTETYTQTGYSDSETLYFGGKSNVIGAVNLWYGFNLTPTWVLQVGGTYDLGKTKSPFYAYGDSEGDSYQWGFEESKHGSIYLAPGYRVTPKTLVYGKIAYHRMKGSAGASDGDQWFSKSFSGLGLGAGVSTMLTSNLYAYAEAQHVMYEAETVYTYTNGTQTWTDQFKPTSTIGSIGLGYNF